MKFASRVFLLAGIYGLIVMVPQYFLENKVGTDTPPAITHPEYFYGFAAVGMAWQVAFLIMSTDPARYRPLMWAAILEKVTFGAAAIVLFWQGRLTSTVLGFGAIDLTLAALFFASYIKTG